MRYSDQNRGSYARTHRARFMLWCLGLGLVFFFGMESVSEGAGLFKRLRDALRQTSLDQELRARRLITLSEEEHGFSPRALVVLAYMAKRQEGVIFKYPRIGFAIGDGSLVLTAAHCVDDFNEPGRHATSRDTVLISPHYGDVYDFKVVAADYEADVAILEPAWDRHPALRLGTLADLKTADQLIVAGRSPNSNDFLENPERKTGRPYRFKQQARGEQLPLVSFDDSQFNPVIRLRGTRYVMPGWSGSALVVPESGAVVGITTRIHQSRKGKTWRRRDALGASISSIERLLRENDLLDRARMPEPALDEIDDANQLFCLGLKYVEAGWNRDWQQTVQIGRELVAHRPHSPMAHQLLAYAGSTRFHLQNDANDLAEFEASYQRSVSLAPDNARFHATYGNFLYKQERYSEARPVIEKALSLDPDHELALVDRLGILSKTDVDNAPRAGQALVIKDPNNPHYWFYYSRALVAAKQDEQALEAAEKAVALNPEGLYRGHLAMTQERSGQMEQALSNYRDMIETCKCQQCWFQYTQFLVRRYPTDPNKLETAEAAFAQVANKDQRQRIERDRIDALRVQLNCAQASLLEKESLPEAEQAFRRLVDTDPNEGDYWWALAHVLRSQEKLDEALVAIRQAVTVAPDDRSFDARLADILGRNGHLEEAEQTYKRMLKNRPKIAKYWFWYARFLVDYIPERSDEARRFLDKAEAAEGPAPVDPDELAELRDRINELTENTDS
jgi:tetratricopeptide (TPR) repeat protein